MKKKILLFADWYAPGYKAGGPIRSCVNFTQHMERHYDVYVFTSDRDLGDHQPYENIETNRWVQTEGSACLYYCSPEQLSLMNIRRQIRSIRPDFIYLNSMFSLHFTIYPLLLHRWSPQQAKLILSPRGMLRESALSFKPGKKKLFLYAFRRLGLHRRVSFHATDATEQKDIQKYFGPSTDISLLPNLPGVAASQSPDSIGKQTGELSMVFVGRIHPIKNLDYLLRILARIDSPVRLTIIGSLEDRPFWEKCRQMISELPPALAVEYLGELSHDKILPVIRQHHIFVLPTKGENFGHAIFEALSQRRPVMISDQTPWRNLRQANAGWDLSLQDPGLFEKAILEAIGWDQAEYARWSEGAFKLAAVHSDNSEVLEKYNKLFS
jgi:glycosyltransferase involved in cell wall biosynthesis